MGEAKFYARRRFFYSLMPETDDFYQGLAFSPYCLTPAQYLGKIRFYKNRKRWIKTYKKWGEKRK